MNYLQYQQLLKEGAQTERKIEVIISLSQSNPWPVVQFQKNRLNQQKEKNLHLKKQFHDFISSLIIP